MSGAHLLTLSAATPGALEEATDDLAALLEHGADLATVTRAMRERPAEDCRRAVVATDPADAARALRKRDARRVFTDHASSPPVVFLFSGVGEQHPGMAAGLYARYPVFRRELDRCFALLRPELGVDLHELLFPLGETPAEPRDATGRIDLAALFDRHGPAEEIHGTLVAQPLMFAVQYAMARLLRSLGVVPSAMLGYSVGEYAAACVAGVMPIESALRLVALRARLVGGLPEGAMLAVMSAAGPLEPYLGGGLSVAAIDGPELTVLAGPVEAVEAAGKRLIDDGIACRRLTASHAFHSALMEPVVPALRGLLATVPLRPPATPFASNVTGTWIEAADATNPDYWGRHLRQTIRFADDLAAVAELGAPVLIELGPGQNLTGLARRSPAWPRGEPPLGLRTLPGPFERRSDVELLLTTIGRLWAAGASAGREIGHHE